MTDGGSAVVAARGQTGTSTEPGAVDHATIDPIASSSHEGTWSPAPGDRSGSASSEVVVLDAPSEKLEREWRKLAEARSNPFLTPEWQRAALRHIDSDRDGLILAERVDGKLRAVLPLVVGGSDRAPAFACPGSRAADILHLAAKEENEIEAARAFAPALRERLGRGSLLIRHCLDERGWSTELAGGARPGLSRTFGPPNVLPFKELPSDWDQFLASRSRNFRSQTGQKWRVVERNHAATLRVSGPQRVEEDMEILFRLHDARWGSRSGRSNFVGESLRAFHREFAGMTAERGWLRLLVLELDGSAAAAWYGWAIGGRWLYYQSGFDPSYARHSLGFLLHVAAIKQAIEGGAEGYDMLLGDEEFKRRLTSSERSVRDVALAAPGSIAHLRTATRNRLRRGWRRAPGPARAWLRDARPRAR